MLLWRRSEIRTGYAVYLDSGVKSAVIADLKVVNGRSGGVYVYDVNSLIIDRYRYSDNTISSGS